MNNGLKIILDTGEFGIIHLIFGYTEAVNVGFCIRKPSIGTKVPGIEMGFTFGNCCELHVHVEAHGDGLISMATSIT